MADRAGRRAPYQAARLLWAWATVNAAWVGGTLALRAGLTDLDSLPPRVYFDLIYALVLEDTKEMKEGREKLDALLDRQSTGKPDRETWGRLPHQQRAMKAASEA